jgi:MFS transporter, OFA family, oxalate/formate antiporter
MEERLPNRIMFPLLGIGINMCLGNLYAWSVFRKPLQAAYGWTAAEATLPFQISIAFFAIAMVFAGRWQDKAGPRTVGMVGGVLFGVGFVLSSMIGSTLMGLYLAYGVICGIAMGCAYVTPLAVTIKWWPDKRGLMTGLVVMGFGAGAIIGGIGGPLLISAVGVMTTFLIFGIVFGGVVTLCAAMLRNPPPGYKPAGWSPPAPAPGAKVMRADYSPGEMVGTPQFYLLWTCYFIGSAVGLTLISQASPIGQEMAGLTPVVAGGAVTLLAVFNGLGRPGFGWISDAVGRRNAVILDFVVLIAAMLLVLPNATSFGMYALGVCMVGFGFGGFLALMPAFTADFWGTKNLGINYGWVFSAWGAAGVFGPILGLAVRRATGVWMNAFYIYAGLCVLGIVLMLMTKAPTAKEAEAKA